MTNLMGTALDAAADLGLRHAEMERCMPEVAVARLTISLPRSLYRDFRLHALEMDTTISALVARLIREELG